MYKSRNFDIIGALFKAALYISSYIPLFGLIYIKQAEEHKVGLMKVFFINKTFWVIIIIISIISLLLLIIWLIGEGKSKRKYNEIEALNVEVLNYFITYLIPMLSLDVSNNYSILMNGILFMLIGLVHIRSNMYHMNILLLVIGYKVYKTKSGHILISKIELEDETCELNVKPIGVSKFNIVKR
ncbi:hypothetical protein [Mammaliicoccus sp. H-M34]|uniref:hypothetical protein n=1 Tax=Mammaliicoccus sp. H-M34 TaxID=2898693 RepID=UPI001EFB2AB0|nr:hypothetical protein [Mammaliicoccus sp. H-M34]